MTVTPEPDEDPIVNEAIEIVRGEQESANLEAVFMFAAKVGGMLLAWREMMSQGGTGFPGKWIDEASMTLFEKFFHPFVPDYGDRGDDD